MGLALEFGILWTLNYRGNNKSDEDDDDDDGDVLHKPVSQLPYVNIFSLTHRKATSTSILLHSLSALMSALKPILKW